MWRGSDRHLRVGDFIRVIVNDLNVCDWLCPQSLVDRRRVAAHQRHSQSVCWQDTPPHQDSYRCMLRSYSAALDASRPPMVEDPYLSPSNPIELPPHEPTGERPVDTGGIVPRQLSSCWPIHCPSPPPAF